MSFHYNRSSSSQSISITPTYSFEELQDIWNLQKEILNKYKSSQVPFVILDQDNSGVISSKDFPYRLVARGFPCNTALYLKFFAFLDTNNDGFINMEDWIEGFKSIGARFVETRCKAREELKAANLIAHSRTSSSIDGYSTTPAKYAQNSFEASSSQKNWATPKNIESCAILQTPIQLTQYSSDDPMQRINFGFNSQLNNGQGIGRRLSTEPHSIMHNKQEQTLQIDTSGDTHKDAAMRINARVDNILKNIESRKNLFSGVTPKMDFMSDIKRTEGLVSPTAQFQKMSAGLKSEAQNQKPEEIHHSIKKSAADTIGAIRSKLGLDPLANESAVKIIEEKGAYTPSVTSITGTEEDVPTPKVTENIGFGKISETKENNLQIKSLKSLLPQRKPSPQESKRSLASQSSASRGEEGNSYLDQVTRAIAAKRKNNSQNIAIPKHSASEKDLETPSWKDSPAFRTGDLEEGAVLEMMEKLLEKYGSHDEALKSLRKEDLLRFPRLRMFVNSLEGQTWFKDKVERGRQFCNGVRKRSRTKSMIELRVKGDLVKEIEMEVQRRRAITPDISMSHIVYKDTVKADKRPDRIANAEKMIESLKEFAKQSIRAKGKTKSQKVGAELAKEILEGKEARNGLSVYNRVQEKLRGERKYGEAQRTCQEVREMFGSRKKEVKTEIKKSNNEEVLSNFGYSIQLDEFRKNSSSSLLRRESPLNRKENIRGIVEDEKRLKLRGVIDQLSHEAASMEASFSRSRTDLRKPLLQEPIDSKQRLLNLMTQKNEVKVEKLLVPEKRRVKSFIRGSISSSHLGSDDFCSTQSSIETQLRDRLSQNRPVNRYSKLANDLGALSVTIDKPERKVSISPIHRTRTSKNSSISVSSLLKEEYLGRGKSFLQSDYTGMSSLLKEFSTPATTKSTKRIGFNKYCAFITI